MTALEQLIEVLRGPWGLLAQLLALGYVLSAFALYGMRRRFFHPDMINVLGAAVGGLIWLAIEAAAIAGGTEPVRAWTPLGTLLALPTVGATLGRAYWLFVAHRDEERRESLTKWEYKTHASAIFLILLIVAGAVVVAPAVTLVLSAVVAAAWFSRRGEHEPFVLLARGRSRGWDTEVDTVVIRTNRRARRGWIELDREVVLRIASAAVTAEGVVAIDGLEIKPAAHGGWSARLTVRPVQEAAGLPETATRRVLAASARAVIDAV
ncbi:MAG: hypothetical protein ABIZ50_03865, partial [Solirubrobacterales bacterium]